MKISSYFFPSIAGFILITACSATQSAKQTGPVIRNTSAPPEMHAWFPPSENELELRRQRQNVLDEITNKIEKLFFKQNALFIEARSLEASMNQFASRINSIEPQYEAELVRARKIKIGVKNDLADIQRKNTQMQTEIAALKNLKEPVRPKSINQLPTRSKSSHKRRNFYKAGIQEFRLGKYRESIRMFERALKQHPSPALADNIYFGIGASLFKLKKYPDAAAAFDSIVKQFPEEDKGLISMVMLGVVHHYNGDTSQALYFLTMAREKNISPSLDRLIDRLLNSVREEIVIG
jgi:TolA-binding protein